MFNQHAGRKWGFPADPNIMGTTDTDHVARALPSSVHRWQLGVIIGALKFDVSQDRLGDVERSVSRVAGQVGSKLKLKRIWLALIRSRWGSTNISALETHYKMLVKSPNGYERHHPLNLCHQDRDQHSALKMAPKILIFGAGSIGGVYSYLLSRAVPASNITVTCRSNYDAVSKNGFTVNSTLWGKGLNARPSVVRTISEAVQSNGEDPFDYVIVTSKALNTTPSTAELIKPAVAPGKTTIVLIQNGIDTEAPFAKLFPENPILTTVVYLPATQTSPGVIEHQEVEMLHIGTYPASAPPPHKAAAQAFSDLLSAAKASSKVHDDVQTERWSKLIVNASWNSICALTRCRDRQLLDITNQSGAYEGFIRGVMLEIAATAQAYGYANINEELVDFQLSRACVRQLPGIQPSMMADALAGRNIEVDAIVGNTVRLASEKGVSTPMLQTIYFLASGLDNSFTLARS